MKIKMTMAAAFGSALILSPSTAQEVSFDLTQYVQEGTAQNLDAVENIPVIGADLLGLSTEDLGAVDGQVAPSEPGTLSPQAPILPEPQPIIETAPPAVVGTPTPAQPQTNPVFGIESRPDPLYAINQQRQLLEQYNSVVDLMREIKEQGNETAVMAMLAALSNDQTNLELLEQAFKQIEVDAPVQPPAPQIVRPQRPAAAMAPQATAPVGAGQVTLAHVNNEIVMITEPAPPVVQPRHPVIPVFAQVMTEQGGTDKVIVAVGNKRFTKLVGETIDVDGRSILIERIEAEMHPTGRYTYLIHTFEDGKREVLSWH